MNERLVDAFYIVGFIASLGFVYWAFAVTS